jgi:8-oxo-dGTP pyrophosphatase MutT (NUDIX family)
MTFVNASWYERPPNVPGRTSAGGVVARLAEDDRVVIALTREPDYRPFILPKGGVEASESLEAAARREIAEEAGLSDLHLLAKLGQRERLDASRTRWITAHYFLFATRQVKGLPTDPAHRYQLAWAPLEALPVFLWPEQLELVQTNAALIERLLREFLAAPAGGA